MRTPGNTEGVLDGIVRGCNNETAPVDWHGVGRSGRNKLPVRAAAAPAYFGMMALQRRCLRISFARRDARK